MKMHYNTRAEVARVRQAVETLLLSKNISRGDGDKVSKREFIYLWSVIANETHCSDTTARKHVREFITGTPSKPLGRPKKSTEE